MWALAGQVGYYAKFLTSSLFIITSYLISGGVAQLGERLNGIQEVKSSILSVSTRKKHLQRKCFFNEINPYERRQGTEKTENRPLIVLWFPIRQ